MRTLFKQGSATVPVASVGVPPTDSARGPGESSSAQSSSHAPRAVARDAQRSDRDGRAPHSQEQIQRDKFRDQLLEPYFPDRKKDAPDAKPKPEAPPEPEKKKPEGTTS